jgi:hypothetical protein
MREFVTDHRGWERVYRQAVCSCKHHKLWERPWFWLYEKWMAVTLRLGDSRRTFLT